MSGLCGWAGAVPNDAVAVLAAMTQRLNSGPQARTQTAVTEASALAIKQTVSAASLHAENGLLVAAIGATSAQRIAEQYRRVGIELLQQLSGTFAIAIVDERSGKSYLAVDRMGVGTLSYAQTGNGLVFASSGDSINAHPAIDARVAPQSIYDYVYFHMVPGPATIFVQQFRILPGELVTWSNNALSRSLYWSPRFTENGPISVESQKQEFLDVIRAGVASAAQDRVCGTFLSGGTDSSTLAGMLTQVTGRPARTYSIGFAEQGYDEMEFARIAVKHFGTDHHEYYVTPDDVVNAVQNIAAIYDQPFGNASAVPTYYCARMAKQDGVERLLGGDGGDELFGGNERYAKQHVFSFYDRTPSWLTGMVAPLALAVPGGDSVPVLKKARSYIRQARVPMPDRLHTYNLLERFGAAHVFQPDFLAQIDLAHPSKLQREIYHGTNAQTQINRMLALDWRITLADSDLPKVNKTCELAGVDVAYPLLDDRVVDFSLRLAPELKLKGTKLRYFFKEALRGFLPEAILTKEKHGFGLPFGPWMQKHAGLQQIVRDSLGSLRARNIFQKQFLDQLIDLKVSDHPGYYGTMIWVLMMLEQWFQKHARA